MYKYYILDDTTGMYLIGRLKLGAPVPTCLWGERRADAMDLESAAEARKAVVEIGRNTALAYRLNRATGEVIQLNTGGPKRPEGGG